MVQWSDKFIKKLFDGLTFASQVCYLGTIIEKTELSILSTLKALHDSKAKPVTIHDIHKLTRIGYPQTLKSIRKLEKVGKGILFGVGFVTTEQKGNDVYVSITPVGRYWITNEIYLGEEDKTFHERLIKRLSKKYPHLILKEKGEAKDS